MDQSEEGSGAAPGRASKTSSGVRQGNTRRVLEALRLHGPSSQAALARWTQLSAATVNSIVKTLRQQGVAEIRPLNGRESLVALVAGRGAIVAVQVNVTSLRAALFDFTAQVRYDAELTFGQGAEEGGGDAGLVADTVRSLTTQAGLHMEDLAGVAVGMQAPSHGPPEPSPPGRASNCPHGATSW
ncbi:winged helix-turn-helix transcriptional regulator [Streptomyces sp. CA-249302]|uniref:winged helix-turn-helix transcriptional regulator n=1 Tax=Streptomyces sp. CA-249302 TaxID=3240058 RepID=UPI003D93536D